MSTGERHERICAPFGRIRATGDGYRYEGTVSKDGQLLRARRVES
jgi:hypothetical protein